MALNHFLFWSIIDSADWFGGATARRRNCWYIMKNGRPGVSIDEVMRWPLSRLRLALMDLNFLIVQEQKNAKAT
jgi:hypothetical protein